MIIRNHTTSAPKGQNTLSPGQRPGLKDGAMYAIIASLLLPLQGEITHIPVPRALPWAMRYWPFRPLVVRLRIIII